jgi:hypothetical protein
MILQRFSLELSPEYGQTPMDVITLWTRHGLLMLLKYLGGVRSIEIGTVSVITPLECSVQWFTGLNRQFKAVQNFIDKSQWVAMVGIITFKPSNLCSNP